MHVMGLGDESRGVVVSALSLALRMDGGAIVSILITIILSVAVAVAVAVAVVSWRFFEIW